MRVWLWIPQLLASLPLRNSFSTHLSIPTGRVRFSKALRDRDLMLKLDGDVAKVYSSICDELGLPIMVPLDELHHLPRLTQLTLCIQASLAMVSRSSRDLVEIAMMESAITETDPGIILSLHCCAKYGTLCVARVSEFVRPSTGTRLCATVLRVERSSWSDTVVERDTALCNLMNKMLSHAIAKIVNARSCKEVMEYLRVLSSLAVGLTNSRIDSGKVVVVMPWMRKGLDIVYLSVECHEVGGC